MPGTKQVHVPQFFVPPQPSLWTPHSLVPHCDGVQPQMFAVPPPPHEFGDVQLPHARVPPH